MSAAANAAAYLYFNRDNQRLRDWQTDIDLHRLQPAGALARQGTPGSRLRRVVVAGPRVSYRKRKSVA